VNPLDALLRPIASLLNETIAETTPAREHCAALAGTVATVRLRHSALAVTFRIEADRVAIESGAAADPDVAISGSLTALARLAASGDTDPIRDGSVELIGDAETAAAFQRLLRYARPDPEEQVARVFGDTVAHSVGQAARGARDWARGARTTMSANLREYLQEEGRNVPSRWEAERFAQEVDRLRDDVERLAARIDRLGGPR
jgi:ubiquinone biosynthesis accessory factor UbiJ